MDLTDDDVFEIMKLFEQSKFDYLHLEQSGRQITLSKPGYSATHGAHVAGPIEPSPSRVISVAAPKAALKSEPVVFEEGLIRVTAPMMGVFYAAPSPAEPSFVQLGEQLAMDATLGLIEVMKVFTSVKANVAGTVQRILVSNGQSVELGQTLFLIRPTVGL